MRATCARCGQEASVRETPNGFSYTLERDARLRCPIVQERMEKEATNMDCEHMQDAVQSLADRLRGTIVSQSKT
jgi:hypothetical protein